MCGKFRALFSWREMVDLYEGPTRAAASNDEDREVIFRPMTALPLIVYDNNSGKRRVIAARWGFPKRENYKIPQPIHARVESFTDPHKPFLKLLQEGKRAIVMVASFNEAPDIEGPTLQHTITPNQQAVGLAFLWNDFPIPDPPGVLRCCVMVTVPANKLIATLPTDRMPAALETDAEWATWLGEPDTSPDPASVIRTVENFRWTMTPEERKASPKPRKKPVVSDPGGLF